MLDIPSDKGSIQICDPIFNNTKLLNLTIETEEGFENQSLDLSELEASKLYEELGNRLNKTNLLSTLLDCERIRVLGYAREHDQGRTGKILHIGLELWTKFTDINDSNDRNILMKFLTQESI